MKALFIALAVVFIVQSTEAGWVRNALRAASRGFNTAVRATNDFFDDPVGTIAPLVVKRDEFDAKFADATRDGKLFPPEVDELFNLADDLDEVFERYDKGKSSDGYWVESEFNTFVEEILPLEFQYLAFNYEKK